MSFDKVQKYPEAVCQLPVYPYLDTIAGTLKNSASRFLILTAETAAGKSTAVPLALETVFPGKILISEPRRLAVTAVANRLAALYEELPGKKVGYRLRFDTKVSASTRIEIMTDGILTRIIQQDPGLDGISVIVLDEFHERSVYTDVTLAFLKDIMQLRDDLYVLIMSATIDTDKIVAYIGDSEKTPVFHVSGRKFPVSFEYRPFAHTDSSGDSFAVAAACADVVAEEILHPRCDVPGGAGSVLVFLPGIAEIRYCCSCLQNLLPAQAAEILVLHSSVPLEEQKRVLDSAGTGSDTGNVKNNGNNRRRVIVSSSVAETSLTVPDVTLVVDSGLCRINRFDIRTGMGRLVTETESVFSAEQRAGRAGRLQPGRCIRMWAEADRRITAFPPEICRSDNMPVVLECALWGATELSRISWLDEPSVAGWNAATRLLEAMGCIKNGTITEKGKIVLQFGVHPRAACVALSGVSGAVPVTARYAAASDAEYHSLYADLNRRLNRLSFRQRQICSIRFLSQNGTDDGQRQAAKNTMSRLQRVPVPNLKDDGSPGILSCAGDSPGGYDRNNCPSAGNKAGTENNAIYTAVALLAGYPDRLAVSMGSGLYQFPSGRTAVMDRETVQNRNLFPRWIVAPDVDAGERCGKIYAWEPVPDAVASSWLDERKEISVESVFETDSKNRRRLVTTEYSRYGKIILSSRPVSLPPEQIAIAVCSAVKAGGFNMLPFSEQAESFLLRARFRARYVRDADMPSEKLSEAALLDALDSWLLPFLPPGGKLDEQTVADALYWYCDGAKVDYDVPLQIILPNGKKRRIRYEQSAGDVIPVLETVVQDLFGCFETPRIAGVRVLLRLLSPARRPLQVTSDLAGFWRNTWPNICKEMKGRYPKHNWDYRIPVQE